MAQEDDNPFAFLPLSSATSHSSPPPPLSNSHLNRLLHLLRTRPSNIPYRPLNALLSSSISSDHPALLPPRCYLALLSATTLAYDELQFSSALSAAIRPIRTRNQTGPNRCNRNSNISTDALLPHLLDFTSQLCTVINSKSVNVDDSVVPMAIVDAVAHLLSHAHLEAICKAALSIITALLGNATTHVNGIIYKRVFPLLTAQLPSPNKKALSNLLIQTAAFELNLSSTNPSKSPANSNQQLQLPIANFLIKAVQRAPERAERRTSISQLIFDILDETHPSVYETFRAALPRLARHPRSSVRLFTAELVATFISRASNDEMKSNSGALLNLINILSARSADKMPLVRAKALASLTDVLRSLESQPLSDMLPHFLRIAFSLRMRLRDPKSRVRKAAVDFVGVTVLSVLDSTPGTSNQMSGDDRASRPSVAVVPRHLQLVTLLQQRSFDAVSSVRIVAVSHITSILLEASAVVDSSTLKRLFTSWIESVLPHTTDSDARCQEMCFKWIESVLLSQMTVRRSSNKSRSSVPGEDMYNLSDMFLEVLGGSRLGEMERCRKAVVTICKKGVFGTREIAYASERVLEDRADTEENSSVQSGAWIMLAEIASSGKTAAVVKAIGRDVVLEEVFERLNTNACKIAGFLATSLSVDDRKKLATAIEEIMFSHGNWKRCDWVDSAPAVIELLSSLGGNNGSDLLDRCDKQLLNTEDVRDESENISLLTIVGSICVSFKLCREPPADIATYVQALASNAQKSPKTRAFALITLGKLCLCEGQNATDRVTRAAKGRSRKRMGDTLTRRYLSVFVHELDNATSSATRNNAVIILCDLCRQYTAIVEPYIPRLANLLGDPSEFVRVQVMSSLIGLLQEDYIKIRSGPVFYEIVRCLLDPSEAVRGTAEYAILDIIPQKNQSLLAVCFVELIFVLNRCTNCPTYNQFPVAHQRKQSIHCGLDTQDQRRKIYQAFLKGMTVDQKLRLSGRLRSDIISLVADKKLLLSSSEVIRVLDDTLMLLCCPEVRSTGKGVSNDSAWDAEDGTAAESAARIAEAQNISKKASLLNKLQFVELRETTIPALLELRHYLEKERSSLLSSLMKCICTLLTPHQENLETVIADAQVRSEIKHELDLIAQAKLKSRLPQKSNGVNLKKRVSERRKGAGGNNQTPPATPPANSTRARADMLSVPRTRTKRKSRKVQNLDSDSDEEFCMSGYNTDRAARTELLSARIEASPKLAAIARRGADEMDSDKPGYVVNINDNSSGFAAALARIESASVSADEIPEARQKRREKK